MRIGHLTRTARSPEGSELDLAEVSWSGVTDGWRPRYVLRGSAMGPLASGPGMTVSLSASPVLFRIPGDETGAADFMERWICTLRKRSPAG